MTTPTTTATTTAIMYLNRDPDPNKRAEFDRVAADLSIKFDVAVYGVHEGSQVLDTAELFQPAEVEHLIFVCHGFSNRLLSSKAGVHVTQHRPPAMVSLDTFARAWSDKLARDCKVSLCACSCGREPYSREAVWGPAAHSDGGINSFAGKLRDALIDRGVRAEVRSHTTPGHVLANPACRTFGPRRRETGRALFSSSVGALLGVKLSWVTAKKFNSLVKGELASRWILFDDDGLVEEIVSRWRA